MNHSRFVQVVRSHVAVWLCVLGVDHVTFSLVESMSDDNGRDLSWSRLVVSRFFD